MPDLKIWLTMCDLCWSNISAGRVGIALWSNTSLVLMEHGYSVHTSLLLYHLAEKNCGNTVDDDCHHVSAHRAAGKLA